MISDPDIIFLLVSKIYALQYISQRLLNYLSLETAVCIAYSGPYGYFKFKPEDGISALIIFFVGITRGFWYQILRTCHLFRFVYFYIAEPGGIHRAVNIHRHKTEIRPRKA